MDTARVENMTSPRTGRAVPNQFLIYVDDGVIFQSYSSPIAHRAYDGTVTLDAKKWDASQTAGKYRNAFLGEGIAETRRKIADGTYTLADLSRRL